jgi:hypothetical protein
VRPDRDDEQGRAVHEQLIGARDEGGGCGERHRAARIVGGSGGPLERAAEPATADDDRGNRPADTGRCHRSRREACRADDHERRGHQQAHGAVGEEHDRIAAEPARPAEDAPDDVRDAVREHAHDERGGQGVARGKEVARDERPAGGERDPEREDDKQ